MYHSPHTPLVCFGQCHQWFYHSLSMSLPEEMQRSLGQGHSCQERLGADSLCVYLDRSEQLLSEILDHLGQHVFWHCPVESIWSSLHPLSVKLCK